MLNGLNVIITRPKKQAVGLMQRIAEKNGTAFLLPTLAIEPTATLPLLSPAMQKCDIAIFISRNAVEYAGPFLPSHYTCKVAAIGPSTASALRQHQIAIDLQPAHQFDSEHLLALSYFQNITHKKIVIVAGEGGRDWLEHTLQSRGAIVTKIPVYKRSCPQIDSAILAKITALPATLIISTSAESLHNLITIMTQNGKAWLFKQTILVVSERLRQEGIRLGFTRKQLILADNATEQAILERLIQWYNHLSN